LRRNFAHTKVLNSGAGMPNNSGSWLARISARHSARCTAAGRYPRGGDGRQVRPECRSGLAHPATAGAAAGCAAAATAPIGRGSATRAVAGLSVVPAAGLAPSTLSHIAGPATVRGPGVQADRPASRQRLELRVADAAHGLKRPPLTVVHWLARGR